MGLGFKGNEKLNKKKLLNNGIVRSKTRNGIQLYERMNGEQK